MSDITEQYTNYKRSTKVALYWIWCNVKDTNTFPVQAFKTTSEIISAAKTICTSQKQVPTYVITALRDAIKYRWRMFNKFASTKTGASDAETKARDECHKAFILRLQITLDLLLPLEDKTIADLHPNNLNFRHSLADAQCNYFESLSLVKEEATRSVVSDTNLIHTIGEAAAEPEKPEKTQQPLSPQDLILQDDEFGEYYVLSYLMNQLDTLLIATNTYWTKAASGEIPLPVAAWLSTTVFHAVERLFSTYSSIAPDYNVLLTKWFKHRENWRFRLRFRDVPGLSTEEGPCWDGIAIWIHGRLINDCRTAKEYEKIVPTAGSRQEPRFLIPRPSASTQDIHEYDNAMDKMQESMRLGLIKKRGISKIEPAEELEYFCEPLLPILSKTLDKKHDPVPLHLVFGYEMLLSSFKTFLWFSEKSSNQNCRLVALKLAMQVKREIKKAADPALFNCKSKVCILKFYKSYLEVMESRLDDYISEVRFDLYYQAPWTAGCHMIEMLTFATYEGLNLCLDSGIVCPLLHLYNALIHLNPPMLRVKVLDELCQVFQDHLFLGVLPKDNFSSHFRRAMGGKLSRTMEEMTPYTRIAMPRKSRKSGTIKRGFSIFYDLQNNNYGPTIDVWERVYLGSSRRKFTSKEERDILQHLGSVPFNVPLDKLKETVMPEFTGPLPVMKLNYFLIHTFCARFMLVLDEKLFYKGMMHGDDMVDDLLTKIMDHLGDSSKSRMLEHWYPMKIMKQVFADLNRQESLQGFVWDI